LTKVVTPFGGDVAAPETFELWGGPQYQERVGSLAVVGDTEMALKWREKAGQPLRRVDRQIALSDNAIQAFGASLRTAIVDDQRLSLSTSDRRAIIKGLDGKVLGPIIDKYYEKPCTTHTEQAARALVVKEVDQYIWRLFHQLHPSDQLRARPWAILSLRSTKHTWRGTTRNLLSWLEEMMHVTPILGADPVPNLREQLNLAPSTRLHYYRFLLKQRLLKTTELDDLVRTAGKSVWSVKPGLGGGFYGGTLEIREVSGLDDRASTIWSATYPISIAQLGIGFGFSFGSNNEETICTPFPWQAHHFEGPIKIVELSFGGATFTPGATGAFFTGDGTFPELVVDFSGIGTNFGAGAGLTMAVGMVGRSGESRPLPFAIPAETLYSAPTSSKTVVHFPFGQAGLTSEGRHFLRVLAAKELAVFRSGHARILIESHADRVDSREYNELLTKCRSWNCYQALKDILGSSLHHSTEHRLLGLGETGAEAAGDKDDVQNASWRRSDIYINGRLVVQLRGEGQSSSL
jgi:outer membrane protein OmpA-like peptidoglycan-associated protein